MNIDSVQELLPLAIDAAKWAAVVVAGGLVAVWRAASFARRRAYGAGGGRS